MVEGDKPKVIPSRMGYNTIPSVVAVDGNGKLLVGHLARRQMLVNPRNTIYGSKRLIGRRFSSATVQEIKRYFTYELVPADGDSIAVKFGNQVLTLPQISALILQEVREVAEDYFGAQVHRAVISVPAFYNERQRSAVKEAGHIAGLTVERIVSEPTAAALAYGAQRTAKQRVLIYDLGGGTFDASVVEIKGGDFQVISTGGDTFLGGVDFDNRLLSQVLYEFLDETGVDLARYPVVVQRLRDACEAAKVELSELNRSEIRVPFVAKINGEPRNIAREVQVDELRSLTTDLVERTLSVCREVLAAKGHGPENLDAVLLVGGQSRFPLIHERIEAEFGQAPSKAVHPDEAVALGTALLAHSIGGSHSFRFRDVLPMSLGIGVPGGKCVRVVERNTLLPFEKRYKISATPGEDGGFELMVFQGEGNRVEDNEYLGTVTLRSEAGPQAGKAAYAVLFSLSQECILTVTATDLATNEEVQAVMAASDTSDSIRAKLARPPGAAAPAPHPGGTVPLERPPLDEPARAVVSEPAAGAPSAPGAGAAPPAPAELPPADEQIPPSGGFFSGLLGKLGLRRGSSRRD